MKSQVSNLPWQVGQTVQWNNLDQPLEGVVICNEFGNIVISCFQPGIIITGGQEQLSQLGWQSVDAFIKRSETDYREIEALRRAARWN